MTDRLTYADVGVDVDVEARAARILYNAAKQTWANREGDLGQVIVPFDDFSGIRYIDIGNLPQGTVMYGGSDGVATKTELAERAGRYDTLAFDLMAMVCDDAVVRGGEPALVKSVLEVNTLGKNDDRLPLIEELAQGYVDAAREAGVAVINGELAQLNDRMGRMDRFSLNWSGDATWFGHESRMLTGRSVQPGDAIVGLREEGLRSNGISLVRRLLTREYGENWEDAMLDGQRLMDLALTPSRIYSKAVVDMLGGWSLDRDPKADLHAVAHITGGGIPEKLGRALKPSGWGAFIDNPFNPSPLMTHCQELGVNDREAYRTWNMGQGMALITPEPEKAIEVATAHGIESKVIGSVRRDPGIRILSRGVGNEILAY